MAFVVEVIFAASAGWQQSAQAAARCKRGAVEARGARHSAPCAAAARARSARHETLGTALRGGGVALPGKALSRVQQGGGHPLVNNARWRAGEAPVPDSTARNS